MSRWTRYATPLRRPWRRAEPSQNVGDPCSDCGEILVLCLQCDVDSRCLECYPYERPTDSQTKMYGLYRAVRALPEAGLLAGTLCALAPTALAWTAMAFATPGPLRTLSTLTGAVSAGAFLAMGAALSKMPLPGETPTCTMNDPTPYDRWKTTGTTALLLQLALVSLAIASN